MCEREKEKERERERASKEGGRERKRGENAHTNHTVKGECLIDVIDDDSNGGKSNAATKGNFVRKYQPPIKSLVPEFENDMYRERKINRKKKRE